MTARPYSAPSAPTGGKRIGLYPGVGPRDYALMGGANARVRRNPDGSAAEGQGGSAGAYADQGEDAAFPASPEAFPSSSGGSS